MTRNNYAISMAISFMNPSSSIYIVGHTGTQATIDAQYDYCTDMTDARDRHVAGLEHCIEQYYKLSRLQYCTRRHNAGRYLVRFVNEYCLENGELDEFDRRQLVNYREAIVRKRVLERFGYTPKLPEKPVPVRDTILTICEKEYSDYPQFLEKFQRLFSGKKEETD